MTLDINSLHSEECPSLVAELQALLTALAEKTNQRICTESQILFDLMSEGDAALSGQITNLETTINSLTNVDDFSQQIANLTNLINSLDLDGDNAVVDDLLNIQQTADNAVQLVADLTTRVDTNQADITNNTTLITQLSQAFNTFQAAVNNSLQTLGDRISNVELGITNLQTDFQSLQEQFNNFGEHAGGEVYCAITTALKNAAPAFMAAFDAALGQPCNVGGFVDGNVENPDLNEAVSGGSAPSFG